MISTTGRCPIGTSGFGIVSVYGRKRVPRPPARITARLDIKQMRLVSLEPTRFCEPIDRSTQTLLEAHAGLISSQRSDQRIVAQEPLNLTQLRTRSLRIRFDFDLRSHETANQACESPYRDFLPAAEINRFSQ